MYEDRCEEYFMCANKEEIDNFLNNSKETIAYSNETLSLTKSYKMDITMKNGKILYLYTDDTKLTDKINS